MKYLLVVLFFILSAIKVQAQEFTATWAAYIQWLVWHENLESSDVGSGSPYPKQYFPGYPEDLGKGLYGWTQDYEYSDDGSKFLVLVDYFYSDPPRQLSPWEWPLEVLYVVWQTQTKHDIGQQPLQPSFDYSGSLWTWNGWGLVDDSCILSNDNNDDGNDNNGDGGGGNGCCGLACLTEDELNSLVNLCLNYPNECNQIIASLPSCDNKECPDLNLRITGTILPARRGTVRISGDWCKSLDCGNGILFK